MPTIYRIVSHEVYNTQRSEKQRLDARGAVFVCYDQPQQMADRKHT